MKYNIIYSDPPWTYRDKASSGKRGVHYKYDLMTLQDIKSLPVSQISADNSILFLWVTFPLLKEGLEVIESWGFKYKTIGFNWVKKNTKTDSLFFGMGNFTRSGSELCLIGTKGKPKRVNASIYSSVVEPIRKHSQKPDQVRDNIVKLMGDLPRVELFAREAHEGWDVIGNEVDGVCVKEALEKLILTSQDALT
jgi:N6-adenosine-specific RNA methylase IME4